MVTAFYSEDPGRVLKPGEIMTYYGRILKGFEYPEIKFAVIAESDIFTEHTKKRRKKKSDFKGEKISSFSDLKIGDYVVHEDHGLGIYRGIEKIESDHVVRDYIKIEYGDGGNLYVLATGLGVSRNMPRVAMMRRLTSPSSISLEVWSGVAQRAK